MESEKEEMLTNCDRTWKINYGFIEGKGKQKDNLTRQQGSECDGNNGDTHWIQDMEYRRLAGQRQKTYGK